MKNKWAAALVAAALVLPLSTPSARAADPAGEAVAALGPLVDDLRVISIEGILIIRGKVRDRATFEAAAGRIERLGEVRVANMLRIVPLPADQRITSEAERSLALARGLRGAELTVTTQSGIVTVRGTVQNEVQRDTAVEIVRRVQGVRDVRVLTSRT